jgi:hypothetical protein
VSQSDPNDETGSTYNEASKGQAKVYVKKPWPSLFFSERETERVSGLGSLTEENSCLTYGHTEDGGDAQGCDSKYEYC